jgi:hypothetical protein
LNKERIVLDLLCGGSCDCVIAVRQMVDGDDPTKGAQMADWQKLANEALGEKEQPISANAGNVNKVAAGIAAAFGVLGPAAIAVFKPLESKPAVEMASAAGLLVAAILAIAIIIASDFRTRGHVTGARFAALAQLASTEPPAATTAKNAGVVPADGLAARAGGEKYSVLAIRWEGTASDPSYSYLLWRTGEKASWFAEHDVDELQHT